jgi:hypothetical protein
MRSHQIGTYALTTTNVVQMLTPCTDQEVRR